MFIMYPTSIYSYFSNYPFSVTVLFEGTWAKNKITGLEKEAKADYVQSIFQEKNDFATLFKAMNEDVFTKWESIVSLYIWGPCK